MIEVRPYHPSHDDAIAALWNRRVAGCFATPPLTPETFGTDVTSKRHFEPDGLSLAFGGGRLVAWAHAGFRSSDGEAPDRRLGTVSMIAVEDGCLEAGQAAVAAAVRYLLKRGARQVGAFTIDFPNTPFYNGLYGGEKAGMDELHPLGVDALRACGFVPASGAVIMSGELAGSPQPPPLPEGTRLSIAPWDSPFTRADAYGIPEAIRQAEILDASGKALAHMIFWHLERYNRASGDRMAVISHMWAAAEVRGTGVAAAMQLAVHRLLREEKARRVSLGTGGTNARAVRFYEKMGCRPLRNAFQFYLDWRRYGDYAP